MHTAVSAEQVLRQFVRGAGPLLARAAQISEVLRAAALTAPNFASSSTATTSSR